MNINRFFCNMAMTVLLLPLLPANAADSPTSGDWQFAGQVFGWGASIGGTSAEGDDIDIDFSDLLDNLDMTLMATLAARKDKWLLLADIIYLDVEDDQTTTANLIGVPTQIKTNVQLKSWVVTVAGGYSVIDTDKYNLDLLAGGRYLWMEADLEFDLGIIQQKYSDSGHTWDGIVGVRGEVELADKWYANYYLDAGAGEDTNLTWQVQAGLNYRFKKVDAVLGYRYLDWDFDDDDTFDDLNISGPYAGVKFWF